MTGYISSGASAEPSSEYIESEQQTGLQICSKDSNITYKKGAIMAKEKTLTVDEIEELIEQKLNEMIGDPDSGLHLKKEFKARIEQRLKSPSKRVQHDEVMKRFA
jgi:hypothetical protein